MIAKRKTLQKYQTQIPTQKYSKISPMLKNDQKWMFTNAIVAYTIGFLPIEKRFPKEQKF